MNLVKSIVGLAAFIAICLGMVFFVLYPSIQWLVFGTWGAAGVFAVLWLVLERQKVLRFLTQKSTRYGANYVLVLFLVLGILTFINILGKDYKWRKDITRTGENSLSPQTLKVLKELPQNVKVSYFNHAQEKEKAEQLFKNYAYANKKFSYEIVDPNRQPTLTKSMGIQRFDTMVLTLADGKNVKIEGVTEEKLTNGLAKLLKTKTQTIYYSLGHGERSLDESADNGENYAVVKKELEKEFYTVKELNLFSMGKIPEDASVLIVAGPRTAFFPKELEIIGDWIRKGGHALVALDLDIKEGGLTPGSKQIASILKEFGIEVGSEMLVDPNGKAANVEPQVLMGFAASKEHPITKDFPSSAMGLVANFLFPLTTYIKTNTINGLQAQALVKTTAGAWAESDWKSIRNGAVKFDQGKDNRGEMFMGVAVEKKDGLRLTVFSTSVFAMNGLLRFAGNRDLFLNSVAWLSGDESTISIRAQSDEDKDRLELNQNWMNFVFLLVVFVMPVSILGTGIWVWFRRRGQ